MKKGLPKDLFIFIAVFILSLSLAEYLVRKNHDKWRILAPAPDLVTRMLQEGPWQKSPIEDLSYEHKPNFQINGEPFTNSQGLVSDREHAIFPSEGVARVALLGDSLIASKYLKNEAKINYVAENRAQDKAINMEVLNFGVDGYDAAREAIVFQEKALKYHPTHLIIAYCLNDPVPSLGPLKFFDPLAQYSAMLLSFKLLLTGEMDWAPWESPKQAPQGWDKMYSKDSVHWNNLVRAYQEIYKGWTNQNTKARPLLLMFPLLYDHLWNKSRRDFYYQEQVREMASKIGFEVHTLEEEFQAFQVSQIQSGQGDIYHLNDVGVKIAAEVIVDWMADKRR